MRNVHSVNNVRIVIMHLNFTIVLTLVGLRLVKAVLIVLVVTIVTIVKNAMIALNVIIAKTVTTA